MKKLLILGVLAVTSSAPAAIIQFDLRGSAGNGLLAANEPGVIVGGTGNEFNTGITFDDVTKFISISVHWGSANGYVNMTGPSTNSHLHQVANPLGNNGTADFMQTGTVVVNIQTDPVSFISNTSASAGSIVGGRVLNPSEESLLMQQRLYLNVHSAANGGGEMRGFLVIVPEPASALTGLLAVGALGLRRRRA